MNFDSSLPSSGGSSPGGQGQLDPKVMEFVKVQQAQAQMFEQIDKLSATCWDICDITPKDKLDGKQQTCLTNCVQRYFDTANYVANRFMTKVQQSQQH